MVAISITCLHNNTKRHEMQVLNPIRTPMPARTNSQDQTDHDLLTRLDEKVDNIVATQASIQQTLKDGTSTYATKDDVATQKRRIDAIMGFGGAILLAVTVALVIAFVKLAGSHL